MSTSGGPQEPTEDAPTTRVPADIFAALQKRMAGKPRAELLRIAERTKLTEEDLAGLGIIVPPAEPAHLEPGYQGGEEADLTGEEFIGFAVGRAGDREPIPPEEQTRRVLLWVLGIAYVLVFVLNIGLALALSPEKYQLIGAAVGSFSSLLAAGLGAAFTYYFTHRGK